MSNLDADRPGSGAREGDGRSIGGVLHIFSGGTWEAALPDGLIMRDGVILFECRVCGEWTQLPVDPEEFDIGSPTNVCGGSPRCCP